LFVLGKIFRVGELVDFGPELEEPIEVRLEKARIGGLL
jgi:hypothetical protein